MISADTIRERNSDEFQNTFDFEAFDKFVEDYFVNKKRNHLYIGLDYDSSVRSLAIKQGRSCKTLAFEKGHKHYIWKADIQIAYSIVPNIEKYLNEHGFKTNQKGACGYDNYDIMVVSI